MNPMGQAAGKGFQRFSGFRGFHGLGAFRV